MKKHKPVSVKYNNKIGDLSKLEKSGSGETVNGKVLANSFISHQNLKICKFYKQRDEKNLKPRPNERCASVLRRNLKAEEI